MSAKFGGTLAILLGIIIVVLVWVLFTTPAPVTSPQATTTDVSVLPAAATSSEPLDKQVVVTTPTAGSTVAHSFEVAGVAPGPWYSEGVFPIQVRDPDDDLIASSQGTAQGEWTTTALVTFTSEITITTSYKGPANLILLKDNPSGDPETMDSVTIPITVQ